jgi:hypothetical protein
MRHDHLGATPAQSSADHTHADGMRRSGDAAQGRARDFFRGSGGVAVGRALVIFIPNMWRGYSTVAVSMYHELFGFLFAVLAREYRNYDGFMRGRNIQQILKSLVRGS